MLACVEFAAQKHRFQKRKSDDSSYICHPLRVARILEREANIHDPAILFSAILHDTLEDTSTTSGELELLFGSQVASIVREVTDDKSLTKDQRKRLQIEHMKHASREARLVKLADKLDNLRDLLELAPKGWSKKRIVGYAIWASKVIEPARGTNSILENSLDAVINELTKDVDKSEWEEAYQEYLNEMSVTTIK